MKHEQFLKIIINFLEKCRCRKVCSLITPTFLNQFLFWQRRQVVQYVLLWNAKDTTDPIKHQESIVDETWAILKNYFNSLEKCRCRKVCTLITPTFLNQFLFWQRRQVVQYVLLWNAKDTTDTKKHQESIVDETWAILKIILILWKNADVERYAR